MNDLIAKLGLTGGLAAAGLAVACAAWFILRGRMAAWRRTRRMAADATEIEDFRRTVGELLLELDQSAARVAGQIQEHFDRLTELQADVEDKLRRYSLASAAPTPIIAERTIATEPATPAATAIPLMPSRPISRAQAVRERRSADFEKPRENSSPVAATRDPRVEQVFELADAGQKPIQIAESTGMLLGEVEILLALRKYR